VAAARIRVQRRPVHGVLLLDKPRGLSSNQALQRARALLRAEKGGHTGTLDPLATGVLPLAFGAATKFSAFQLDADKTYLATLQLGVRTTTGDAEGDVVEERPLPAMDAAAFDHVRQRFVGPIVQIPPMHSALKKDGKALYEYARAGIEVERTPRGVEIFELEFTPHEVRGRCATLDLRVRCSKGTYIRTLAEDIGAALGCGAHLTFLRRTATAHFRIDQCITLPALEALSEPQRDARLQPPTALLGAIGAITLESEDAGRFLSGQRRHGAWPDAEQMAVYGREPEAFLGTARVVAGELIPLRLLSPIEISQMLVARAAAGAPA
jgi:tRNA pseudouridine55 synthase